MKKLKFEKNISGKFISRYKFKTKKITEDLTFIYGDNRIYLEDESLSKVSSFFSIHELEDFCMEIFKSSAVKKQIRELKRSVILKKKDFEDLIEIEPPHRLPIIDGGEQQHKEVAFSKEYGKVCIIYETPKERIPESWTTFEEYYEILNLNFKDIIRVYRESDTLDFQEYIEEEEEEEAESGI